MRDIGCFVLFFVLKREDEKHGRDLNSDLREDGENTEEGVGPWEEG